MRYVIECDWQEYRRLLRNLQYNMRGKMRDRLLEVAEKAAELARSNAPVRTGELRAAIKVQHEMIGGTGLMIAFVADTHYAVLQEQGFIHQPDGKQVKPKWFMRNAVMAYQPVLMRAMGEAALEAVKTNA